MSGLRDFGLIRTTLWQSERFMSIQALDTRLAYIWLHTSFKTSAGVLRIGPPHLLDEVDFFKDLDRCEEVFQELERAGLIMRAKPFTIITKYLEANPVKTFRHAIAAYREVLVLPENGYKHALLAALKNQQGALKLAVWRDKEDNPHEVIHEINTYFMGSESDPEPIGSPSETHQEGIVRGTVRIENIKYKKEKREPRRTKGEAAMADRGLLRNGEGSEKPGPRPETLALVGKCSTP